MSIFRLFLILAVLGLATLFARKLVHVGPEAASRPPDEDRAPVAASMPGAEPPAVAADAPSADALPKPRSASEGERVLNRQPVPTGGAAQAPSWGDDDVFPQDDSVDPSSDERARISELMQDAQPPSADEDDSW
jgi:hypothetical protein